MSGVGSIEDLEGLICRADPERWGARCDPELPRRRNINNPVGRCRGTGRNRSNLQALSALEAVRVYDAQA